MRTSLNEFVKEMLIGLFLIIIVVAAVINGVFSVKMEINIVSIGFIVLLLFLSMYVFKSIKIGLMAIVDMILKSTYEIDGIIQAQIPYEASCFSDKFDEDRHIRSAIRFCIVIRNKKHQDISLISQNFIDVPNGEECTLLVAKHSGIVIHRISNE